MRKCWGFYIDQAVNWNWHSSICFEQLMQQESKRQKHPSRHFPSTSGLTTATQIERVADFCVLVRIFKQVLYVNSLKKTFWQRESRLAGYSTIKINWGDKIMSLTVIHAAVRQLLNGLLLKWPLAFPLNRCSDDAAETEITHSVKGHRAVVQIKSIGKSLNSSGPVKYPQSCGTF